MKIYFLLSLEKFSSKTLQFFIKIKFYCFGRISTATNKPYHTSAFMVSLIGHTFNLKAVSLFIFLRKLVKTTKLSSSSHVPSGVYLLSIFSIFHLTSQSPNTRELYVADTRRHNTTQTMVLNNVFVFLFRGFMM